MIFIKKIYIWIIIAIGYEIFFVNYFEIVFGLENSYSNRILLILLTLCILVPMSLIRNYHVNLLLYYIIKSICFYLFYNNEILFYFNKKD